MYYDTQLQLYINNCFIYKTLKRVIFLIIKLLCLNRKEKMPGTNRRGKRTIAKEKLYKNILKNIRTIYPNFNIGMSTSARGDFSNNWKDPYRHWCFKSKNSIFDSTLTKKKKKKTPFFLHKPFTY